MTNPTAALTRLIWVGPLTVLASIAAVLIVRLIAAYVLRPEPEFLPLTLAPAIIDTAVFVSLGVFVFHRVASGRPLPSVLFSLVGARFWFLDPIHRYRFIAFRVLLVSFLPDIAIALTHRAQWPYAFALATMHVAAWATCVQMLITLTTLRLKKL